MYCTACGNQIDNNGNYCVQCGQETPHRAETRRAMGYDYIGRRLARVTYNKKIAGVCAGLAKYFDTDPTLVRLAALTLGLVSGGLGVLAYVAAWIVMPVETEPGVPTPSAAGL